MRLIAYFQCDVVKLQERRILFCIWLALVASLRLCLRDDWKPDSGTPALSH